MKLDNKLRLARLASRDVHGGGAAALVIARRMEAITGSGEGMEIVTRVYHSSVGRATYQCRECGQEWVSPEEKAECCSDSWVESGDSISTWGQQAAATNSSK